MTISSVWSSNFSDQIRNFNRLLYDYNIISLDTEFPGFLMSTPRKAPETLTYSTLKFNVDGTKLIQLGLTLSDKDGNIAGCWEFNFSFDIEKDVSTADSLEFLKENGMDFGRLKRDGIDIHVFSHVFSNILAMHRNQSLRWVTFHGLYDIAYIVKMVANKPLPDTAFGFTKLVGHIFGNSVLDIKYVARFCKGLYEGELGLQKLANIVCVKRIGGAHQAGSDSHLTAMVLYKLKKLYGIEELRLEGFLYSINARIRKPVRPQLFAPPYLHYYQTKVPVPFVPPPPPPCFHFGNPSVVQHVIRHIYVA